MIELDWLTVAETDLPDGGGASARAVWEAWFRVLAARQGLEAWRPPVGAAPGAGDMLFDPVAGMAVSRRGRDTPADLELRPEAFERAKTRGGGRPLRRTDASRLRAYLARGLMPRELVRAGERFERTWRAAGFDPRVSGAYGEGVGGGFDPFDISDRQAEARLALEAVAEAVGGGLYRILIRVCVDDQAAGEMAAQELERTGKGARVAGMTALTLALERLHEHYARQEQGRGMTFRDA